MNAEENKELFDRVLTFNVGEDLYGLELAYVIEIIGLHIITKVPCVPDYIKGIINLRGEILPVIDARKKYNYDDMTCTERTSIIVTQIENITVGIIVDAVADVVDIGKYKTSEPPEFKSCRANKDVKYILEMGVRTAFIVDAAKFLNLSFFAGMLATEN
ncbi:MAG: chemotaxis protein CheW [Oscillospiraceae bacterium]